MKKLIITALIMGFATNQTWSSTSSTNLGPVKGNIYQPNKKIVTTGKTTAQIEQEANQTTGNNLFGTTSKSAAQVQQQYEAAKNFNIYGGIWGASTGSNKLGTDEKTYESLRTIVFSEIAKLLNEVQGILNSSQYAKTQISDSSINGLINQLNGLIYGRLTGIRLEPLTAEIFNTIKNSDTFKNIQKTYLAEIKSSTRTKPASALNGSQDKDSKDRIVNLFTDKLKQLLQNHNLFLELERPTLSEESKNQIKELIASTNASLPLSNLTQPAHELFSPMEELPPAQ